MSLPPNDISTPATSDHRVWYQDDFGSETPDDPRHMPFETFQLCWKPWDGSLTICDMNDVLELASYPTAVGWCAQARPLTDLPSTASYVNWLSDWGSLCPGNDTWMKHVEEMGPKRLTNFFQHKSEIRRTIFPVKVDEDKVEDIPCSVVNLLFPPLLGSLPALTPIMVEVQARHDRLMHAYVAYRRHGSPLIIGETDRQLSFAYLRARVMELFSAVGLNDSRAVQYRI